MARRSTQIEMIHTQVTAAPPIRITLPLSANTAAGRDRMGACRIFPDDYPRHWRRVSRVRKAIFGLAYPAQTDWLSQCSVSLVFFCRVCEHAERMRRICLAAFLQQIST